MGEHATFSNEGHLSAPLSAMPRLGGPGPFVINLATAGTPTALPHERLTSFPGTQVYQLQRNEDRRVRYRLRLGPFLVEDAADAALLKVRELYPGALTATAADDDLRVVAHLLPRVSDASIPELSLVESVVWDPDRHATPHAREQHNFDLSELSLVDDLPRGIPTLMTPVAAGAVPARAVPLPPAAVSIDSTETLRPLTALDLADDAHGACFVIQLSVAAAAFDPDDLPSLDIFSCYRLYSVAGNTQSPVAHALRLGFFSTEIAARAVQSYIATYYPAAKVERVSRAERERFDEKQRVEARKDVGASGAHAMIEITSDRLVRPRFATTPEPPAAPTAAVTR
jgi:hypothetical protein